MKSLTILFWFLIFCTLVSSAQSSLDSMFVDRSAGVVFLLHGAPLRGKELKTAMKSNYASYVEFWKARSCMYGSYILTTTGSYLIGWELASGIMGDKIKISNAALGVSMCLLSFAYKRSGEYYAGRAATLYNQGLLLKDGQRMRLHFGLHEGGAGIRWNF